MLYPLKFKPIYKTKVWGGDKIKRIKNDRKVPEKCGESWEISGVQDEESIISNGFLKGNSLNEIVEVYMEEIVGDRVFEEYGYEFPILLKIIEAKDNLSVQVHPDDETAAELHNARGKTEAWFILEADEGAKIIDGFTRDTSERELLDSIENGNLESLLKYNNVKSGEFYFIPAGRVHGMCTGTTVVEIQETSDVTYRIYDYNRGRELHTEYAVDVIDYKKNDKPAIPFTRVPDHSNPIVDCKYFTANYLPVMNSLLKDYTNLDSFVIYHCVHGQVSIRTKDNNEEILNEGESIIIPACIDEVVLIPLKYSELLEVYMNFGEAKSRRFDEYDLDKAQRMNGKSEAKSDVDNGGSNTSDYKC